LDVDQLAIEIRDELPKQDFDAREPNRAAIIEK
jgi:hypothetical protein